jgi:hypothetical protein
MQNTSVNQSATADDSCNYWNESPADQDGADIEDPQGKIH